MFTGGVRPTPPAFVLGDPERGSERSAIPPAARWHARQELHADLRTSALLAAALAACGVPVGLLWEALAPRADFRVTADGPVPVGNSSMELSVADDSVLVLLLVGLGLLAGALAWRLRRLRGVTVLVALAVGASVAAVVAWRLGVLMGPGPTEADLARVGAVVTTPLRLSAWPALAAAPFSALLAYLLGVAATRAEDLDRPAERPVAAGDVPGGAGRQDPPDGEDERWAGEEPVDARARG